MNGYYMTVARKLRLKERRVKAIMKGLDILCGIVMIATLVISVWFMLTTF